MHVQVSQYTLGKGTVEELRSHVEEGPVAVMREVAGFVAYYAFDAGGGVVASVAVFEDRAAFEEADRRLASWIEQTVERFEVSPGGVTEGEVFATTRAAVP